MNIEDLIESINKDISENEKISYLNEKPNAAAARVYSLTNKYYRLANIILNKDEGNYEIAKKLYFKQCRGIEFDYWIGKEYYPQIAKGKEFNLHGSVGNYFDAFILCDHDLVINEILNEMEHISQFKKDKRLFLFFAFKYVLNKDLERSNEYFKLFKDRFDSWNKVQYLAVKGILENDVEIINQGIKLAIKEDTIKLKNQPEYLKNYSPKATAVAKLALRFGLQPDISSKLINRYLLVHKPMEFEDIDDLFLKINIVPIKSYDLKNY
ncbi:hypothetical protein EGI22_10565 [Lacihabitans sp. LS3-19]|uniref:hypothetical protein n=1 Tax=Lacihabitans sp. LS3-19 TaxID=2487335 RepID=UPI0020CE826C|nr:hypothetical protein [Lacihabitans sp. LS3-19]MCP9768356.1 hypothetical protein [Lacihabitans sp. LS3-19]